MYRSRMLYIHRIINCFTFATKSDESELIINLATLISKSEKLIRRLFKAHVSSVYSSERLQFVRKVNPGCLCT